MRIVRAVFNWVGGVLSVLLAIWSLRKGLEPSSTFGPWNHEELGRVLIGFWALVPPLFFWLDWVALCSYLPANDPQREIAKHTHDLSRNIWIALVGILTVLFAIKFPSG